MSRMAPRATRKTKTSVPNPKWTNIACPRCPAADDDAGSRHTALIAKSIVALAYLCASNRTL